YIDKKHNTVVFKIFSVVTADDYQVFNIHLIRDLQDAPSHNLLVDAQHTKGLDFQPKFEDIATQVQNNAFNKESKKACVTTDILIIGLVNMLNSLGSESFGKILIFSEMQEARAWLGMSTYSAD
ncbi:MAG: STAS/SEC14 domain-containing protein, partial [Pseudomonadales bacterium]|nr:STAS/SEC14 domain-containing protein [Pseudomonadales bacterium]